MGKKSSDSPNVAGAAQIEGEFSRETARDVTYADRPDQFGPLGNVQWGTEEVIDPATGEKVTKWTQNQNLDPNLQSITDNTLGMMRGRGEAAGVANQRGLMDVANPADFDQFGDPISFDPAAQRQSAEDAAYGRSTSRLDPRFQQESDAMEIKLRNQGLRPGDEAWDKAMGNFGRYKNDAYATARQDATSAGRAETGLGLQTNERANALRNQKIQEYLDKRGFNLSEADRLNQGGSLNELAGLVTGGQA